MSESETTETAKGTSVLVPRWVGLTIAAVLIVGMVGGAALWALGRYLQPDLSKMTEVQAPGARTEQEILRPASNGITQPRPGSYQVRAADVMLLATKDSNESDWSFRLLYNRSDLVSPDDQAAILSRLRIISDPTSAKSIKITDEQVNKLRDIAVAINVNQMVTTTDDVTQIKTIWTRYVDNPKSGSEEAVIKALQEMSRKNLAGTRAATKEAAEKVRTILTPEQLTALKS